MIQNTLPRHNRSPNTNLNENGGDIMCSETI